MGTLHEDQYTFLITSGSILLKVEKFHEKFVRKIKTQVLCSVIFSENCAIYEIM